MKHITTYIEGGRTFEICRSISNDELDGFWAFEDKFIDEAGRLTKVFNGISGHHSATLQETLEKVSRQIKYDALVDGGMDSIEAAMKVCGVC